MNRNFAAIICIAAAFSGSFALSIQSVEAKIPRNSAHVFRNYFVPAPPPYTPSMVPPALLMTYAQAVTAGAEHAVVEKLVNSYSKQILARNQGDMTQVVHSNPYANYNPIVETRVQKRIDTIDSKISGIEKEIGVLLNLEDKKSEEAQICNSDLKAI
ncbi:MAG: hypothetical protein K2Y39_17745 [Candidatus Obscuribacterales bacterium]|nr:hypothetical protein [Candidatus Obscuribacterales bacterium]